MAFYLFFIAGVLAGIFGGMGMGGGTLLIPALTLLFGAEQSTAQGVNLLSFLPMSCVALAVHAKSGLLAREKIVPLALPALLFSAAGAFAAALLPSVFLRKAFGLFLVVLSVSSWLSLPKKGRKEGKTF